jgi:toxin ParE1/3/4
MVIKKSDIAKLDFASIWIHIAEDSVENADKFMERLNKTLLLIATQPFMGRVRPELDEELRSFPVGNYLIFYYPRDYGIEVARVIHGAQKLQPEDFD